MDNTNLTTEYAIIGIRWAYSSLFKNRSLNGKIINLN